MPKISNFDLGQAVNLNHPAAVTYHNQTTGVSTAVQPLPRSARNPDGKLLGLTFMTRNPTTGAPQAQTQVARWKDASPSVRQDLKNRFSMVSPPATPTIPATHLPQVTAGSSTGVSDVHSYRATLANSVTVGSPGNLQDSETRRKFKDFLKELRDNDPSSYQKRYADLRVSEVYKGEGGQVHFFAHHDGKIVGCADYAEDEYYAKGTVATVNNVVLGNFQGMGIGKKLLTARDAHLRAQGFLYQGGGVYGDNTAQIGRLMHNGWRERSDSKRGDEMRFFWKALDSRFANIEPKEI